MTTVLSVADPLAPVSAAPLAEPGIRAARRRVAFVQAINKSVALPDIEPAADLSHAQALAPALLSATLPPDIATALLYRNILGRDPDEDGGKRAAKEISRGGQRAIKAVAARFGASAELGASSAAQQAKAAQFLADMGVDPAKRRHPITRDAAARVAAVLAHYLPPLKSGIPSKGGQA